MPVRIDRVETEVEIIGRKEEASAGGVSSGGAVSGGGASALSVSPGSGGGDETLSAVRGRSALREKLRPIVMEILNDELTRIKRKVGAP